MSEIVFAIVMIWCASGIGATLIERGLGGKFGKNWDNFRATINIFTINRRDVSSKIAWFLVVLARISAITLFVLAIYMLFDISKFIA